MAVLTAKPLTATPLTAKPLTARKLAEAGAPFSVTITGLTTGEARIADHIERMDEACEILESDVLEIDAETVTVEVESVQ